MRITFVGDIMFEKPLMKEFRNWKKIEERDIVFNIKKMYNSDYVVGNLETVFAGKKAKYTRDIYSFNTPDEFCKVIKRASVDCVTTANNHCMDRGILGLKRTLQVLDTYGIDHVGTRRKQDSSYLSAQIGEKKIGILSYTYGTNYSLNHFKLNDSETYVNLLKPNYINAVIPKGILGSIKERVLSKEIRVKMKKILHLPYNKERIDFIQPGDFNEEYLRRIRSEIEDAKKNTDLVIAYIHTGGQFNLNPGDYSKKICNYFYNQGVKIVISSHAHVVQKIKKYKDGIIAYSLGNFIISPNSEYLLYKNKPEYSISLHIDIDFDTNIIRISFSILKVCLIDKHTYVKDCYVFYNDDSISNEEKKRLKQDCQYIYNVVNDINESDKFEIRKEYFIMECKNEDLFFFSS